MVNFCLDQPVLISNASPRAPEHFFQKESASQVRARVDTAGKIGALSLANFELKRVPESLKSIQNKLRYAKNG